MWQWFPYLAEESGGTEAGAGGGTETPPAETTDAAPPITAMDWRRLPDLAPLQDEVAVQKVLEVYPKFEHFVRDAIGWRSEMTRRTRMPTSEAAPEDWQRFWQQLPGYPKEPKGYEAHVTLPELGTDLDGQPLAWDPGLLEDFYTTAHQHGLTATGAQALLELYARNHAQAKNMAEAMEAQHKVEQEKELQKRFGGQLLRKVAAARNYFVKETGNTELGERIWEKIQAAGLADDADFIEYYSSRYALFGEPMDLMNDDLFPLTRTADEIETELKGLYEKYYDEKLPTPEREAAWNKAQQLSGQRNRLATRR